MIWNYLIGILAVLFGVYQILNSYKYVRFIQHHGNKTTSSFSAFTVWYSAMFGLGFFIFGIFLFFTRALSW